LPRYAFVIAAIFVIGSPANASSLCTFTTKCVEADVCTDTVFELRFGAGTGGPNELEIVTDAETVGVAVGGTGETAFLAGLTERGFHVLTVEAGSGAARYTNHVADGPVAVSYLGSCEVTR